MPRKLSEERTRKEIIDPQLEQAGWYLHDHSKVKTEIPVDGYDAEPWNGISDYTLYRENGEVLVLSFVEGLAMVDERLVMATGTGKTRTTMGLINVFMRSNHARRILFV
jgi:type I site-specific restriction endonuclease